MSLTAPAPDANRKLLNRTGASVALFLLVILSGSLLGVMGYEIPEKNHDIVLILMTTVSNAVIGVTSYFFGSSVATSRQGDIIATQADTASKVADLATAAQAATTSGNTPPPPSKDPLADDVHE